MTEIDIGDVCGCRTDLHRGLDLVVWL